MLRSRDVSNDSSLFTNIEEIVGPIKCSEFDLDSFMFPIDENIVFHNKKTGTLTEKDLDYIDQFLKGSE